MTDRTLAELSMQAVQYGQAMMMADARLLARRLYGFGSIPRGPRWDQLMGAGDEAMGLLGLAREGPTRRCLARDYEASTHQGWLSWSRKPEHPEPRPELPYKLYISPRPEALAECFPILAKTLAENRTWSFKVGRGVPGLLRPDKIVAYFADLDHLQSVAAALADALAGCPAQGVPFTAQASAGGLLSWGMDPPPRRLASGSLARESWRYWVTNRLADAIVHAQSLNNDAEPWMFALDQLGLDWAWTHKTGYHPTRHGCAGDNHDRRP
jgi:hypothetical protein